MVRLQGDFAKPPEKRFNYKHCFDALFRVSYLFFSSLSPVFSSPSLSVLVSVPSLNSYWLREFLHELFLLCAPGSLQAYLHMVVFISLRAHPHLCSDFIPVCAWSMGSELILICARACPRIHFELMLVWTSRGTPPARPSFFPYWLCELSLIGASGLPSHALLELIWPLGNCFWSLSLIHLTNSLHSFIRRSN
jgi:hypothetical protein